MYLHCIVHYSRQQVILIVFIEVRPFKYESLRTFKGVRSDSSQKYEVTCRGTKMQRYQVTYIDINYLLSSCGHIFTTFFIWRQGYRIRCQTPCSRSPICGEINVGLIWAVSNPLPVVGHFGQIWRHRRRKAELQRQSYNLIQ